MDGAEGNDRTLRRIIALLASFAVLAERAAGRSFPVRWLVLVILRRAEAVTLADVVDATGADWTCFDQPSGIGSSPADAAILAERFRALAAVLALLLPAACRFGRPHVSVDRAPRFPAVRGRLIPPTSGCPEPLLCDTS